MQTMHWAGVYYEITDYESKLSRIKLPLFQVFRGLHEFNFIEIYIYINKTTLMIFDWKKFHVEEIVFHGIISVLKLRPG